MNKLNLILLFLFQLMRAEGQINDLPRTSPEAVGLRSEQVGAFFDSLRSYPKTEIHSAIVMRHGKIVGEMYPEPFRPEYKHTQFSCSKTFVAAAVGIAIGEKKLRLTDRVVSFFPDHLPKVVSWRLASITVEDLLTMRSGFVVDTKMRTRSLHWIRDYLSHPMNVAPGKQFQYDSIDTYLLSAIVQKVTGMSVLDYLKAKVFKYLKITDVKWELSPEGIVTGGWGLYIQSESLAKFGQLLLQRGIWHGQQLIPQSWVDAMMTQHVERPGADGYCYQMWTCDYPTAIRADGAYGQYVVIIPRQDVVVVITQCLMNSGANELAYIWKTLFQGMSDQPLPPSDGYQQLLERRDTLPLLYGQMTSPIIVAYEDSVFHLGKNPLGWSSLSFEADDVLEVTDTAGITGRILLGYQNWASSPVFLYPLNARYAVKNQFSTIYPPFRYAACYAWIDEELQVKLHCVDWMGGVWLRFRFNGSTVTIVAKENYQSKPVTFVGTL